MYREITLQLNEACNLHCPYCFAPNTENCKITDDNLARFISFCKKVQPDCIHLTGGEPTMHPRFPETVTELQRISSLVIYSNLTLLSPIARLENRGINDTWFLANCNNRELYSEEQWRAFLHNIDALQGKGYKVALGHTFYNDDYKEELEKVIQLAKTRRITHVRISQAIMRNELHVGLNPEQCRALYDYIAEVIAPAKADGIKLYFDCPVPTCYLNRDTVDYLLKHGAMRRYCEPKAFIRSNMQVSHCYTTIGKGEVKALSDFETIEAIKEYSKGILKEQYHDSRAHCSRCEYNVRDYPCGCPLYN